MQVVHEAESLIDAYLAWHALEGADIPVFIRGEALLGGVGELPACGLLAGCVPRISRPQARAMTESLPLLAGETGDVDGVPLVDGALPA